MKVYKIVKFSQILSSLLIYEVLIQSNKYISFMPIIHSSLSLFLRHFLTFYLVYVPSWYYDICSFHMSISLYQCCKPQVALGSNTIVSLNFVSSFNLIFFSFDFFLSQPYYESFLFGSLSYLQFLLLFTKFVVHILYRFWLSFISKVGAVYFRKGKEWSRIHPVPNIQKIFWFLF